MHHRFFALFLGIVAGTATVLAAESPATDVSAERMAARIERLSQFGANPEGGVSRVAFSDADVAGREYIKELMRDAGLDVRVDTAGNVIGRREGSEDLPVIMFGSHIDSVPGGGNYDGDVGVIGAIEVAQVLEENGLVTRAAAHGITVTETMRLSDTAATMASAMSRKSCPASSSIRRIGRNTTTVVSVAATTAPKTSRAPS
jgi:N-carbamoyl-L-amino-acid hydrolase